LAKSLAKDGMSGVKIAEHLAVAGTLSRNLLMRGTGGRMMARVSDEYLNRLIALSESQCLSKHSSSEINTNQLLKILYELKYRRSVEQESK
jgi:hypothetical protein